MIDLSKIGAKSTRFIMICLEFQQITCKSELFSRVRLLEMGFVKEIGIILES